MSLRSLLERAGSYAGWGTAVDHPADGGITGDLEFEDEQAPED